MRKRQDRDVKRWKEKEKARNRRQDKGKEGIRRIGHKREEK